MAPGGIQRIVLAYSGGLDTSVAMKWLKETYDCDLVAVCVDVGQGEDLAAAKAKALSLGATSAHVLDLQHEFVRDYVFPALRAGAIYEGEYLLGTSLARPCIAKGMMEVYRQVGADAISHGATGKGNDQVRFELAAYHFDPAVKIVAVWREWTFGGRQSLIDYAHAHGIAVEATTEKPYSRDRNLFHTSHEGGVLEDPWHAPSPDMFERTVDPTLAPDEPVEIEIEFEGGDPIGLGGERLEPVELLTQLNRLAGTHGVGRVDMVENRFVGIKSRGVYETPAGTVLHLARRAVESLTLDREAQRLRDDLIPRYAALVYNGFWYAPERVALQQLMDKVAERVTGTARVRLYKGSAQVTGRRAERSLYRADFATFEQESVYDQRDAEGFIKLNALRLRVESSADADAAPHPAGKSPRR